MPENPFYAEYKDAGFQWSLFFPPLFYSLLALIGLPLNFTVCWITYKYRGHMNHSLASPTATLIALQCFFELLHQLYGHFFYLGATVFGVNFISYRTALAIHAIAFVGLVSSIVLLPLLAVDRLLAIASPVFYNNLRHRFYISLHTLAIFTFNVYIFYLLSQAYANNSDFMVTAFVGAVVYVPEMQDFINLNLALMCATIVVYMVVGILVKCKTDSASPKMQKLYRSLLLIVCIHVGGFFLIATIFAVLAHFLNTAITPIQEWFIKTYASLLLDASSAANGLILYFCSSEHKNAYKKEFRRIFQGKSVEKKNTNNSRTNNGNVMVVAAAATTVISTIPNNNLNWRQSNNQMNY